MLNATIFILEKIVLLNRSGQRTFNAHQCKQLVCPEQICVQVPAGWFTHIGCGVDGRFAGLRECCEALPHPP